mgnify:CR=1 FL=1
MAVSPLFTFLYADSKRGLHPAGTIGFPCLPATLNA